ncbi:hypothetical protein MRB53_000474 [Persea americana]|uniref:Uncharacterized protein n=1 Tax=Persea americana TaxID=3435 RepID=A0ACC2MPT2_PERAE|nr:hypothetical protein MRB53_000474 [Persea americana]
MSKHNPEDEGWVGEVSDGSSAIIVPDGLGDGSLAEDAFGTVKSEMELLVGPCPTLGLFVLVPRSLHGVWPWELKGVVQGVFSVSGHVEWPLGNDGTVGAVFEIGLTWGSGWDETCGIWRGLIVDGAASEIGNGAGPEGDLGWLGVGDLGWLGVGVGVGVG